MAENVQESLTYYQSQAYPTQAQRTYDILLEMIALEALPGKKVYTELELCQMLQIGRTPLREALKLLEFDSIIKTIPRLGIQVQECRIEDYCLLAEVRTVLEKVVIRRACRLATGSFQQELDRLNGAYRATCQANDPLALYRVDRKLHDLIDECSKNPYAVHALAPLRFYEQRVHYLLSRVYPEIGDMLDTEHIAYVEAIIAGLPDDACTHFENMVASTEKLVQLQMRANMGTLF